MQTIPQILAKELGKPQQHIENVIALLDEGNTIPFIARYRKEQHGSMDDTALRKLEDRLRYLRNLETRRQEVKSAIDGQGKLTEELSAAIDNAATLAEVEDLYRPYKQKRRTRATIAREKGLEPLALLLLAQEQKGPAPEDAAGDFIDPEKGVETVADALQGANDIIAELLSDDADLRKTLRGLLMRQGHLRSLAVKEEDSVYRLYYDFDQPLPKLAGHQILAVNRGEKEGFLSVTVLLDRVAALDKVRRAVVKSGSAAIGLCVRRLRGRLRPADLPLAGAGGPRHPDRYRQRGRHRTVCPEPEASFDAAAGKGARHHGSGSRLRPRLQGGGDRRHRQGAGHHRGLSHLRRTTEEGGHRQTHRHGPPLPCGAHRHRQRHRQPGDGADDSGDAARPGPASAT